MDIDFDELLNRLKVAVEWDKLKAEIQDVEEADDVFEWIKEVLDVVRFIIGKLDEIAAEIGAGLEDKEKRKALASLIDDLIPLPAYLEIIDGTVIRILVDALYALIEKKPSTETA